MAVPDPRTSGIPRGQQLTTTLDGQYQWAVWVTGASDVKVGRILRGTQRWGVNHDEHTFTASDPGNPFVLPNDQDTHNYPAIGIDGQGFVHIWANMRALVPAQGMRYQKSNQVGSSVWSSITWSAASMPGSLAHHTYPTPVMLPDGTLWFHIHGSNAGGSGFSNAFFWKLGPNTSTWSAKTMLFQGLLVPNAKGPGLAGDDDTAGDTIYNWTVYECTPFVEPARYPHPGRLHSAWCWRVINGQPEVLPSYAYTDDQGTTWKAVDGTTLTLPIDPVNTTACQTGMTHSQGGYISTDGITVDPTTGYPTFYTEGFTGAGFANRKIFWTGSAWAQTTPPNPYAGRLMVTAYRPYDMRGTRWLYGTSGTETTGYRRARLVNEAGTVSIAVGGLLSNSTRWQSVADPIAYDRYGTIEIFCPDGDNPRVTSFGKNARATAV